MMVECLRCSFKTDDKTVLKRHLNRKKPCIVTLNSITREDCLKKLEEPKEKIINYIYCDYCSKKFKRKFNLERHLDTCKKKDNNNMKLFIKRLRDKENENEILKQSISTLQKQMDEVLKRINISTTNSSTNNSNSHNITNSHNTINNNITVLSYHDTDYESVMPYLNKAINKYTNKIDLPKFIEIVHLNPKAPQNHNVFIENSKDKRIMIFNGKDVEEYGRGYDGLEAMCSEKLDHIEERDEFTEELDFLVSKENK